MARISGKTGNVYTGQQVIDSAEVAWTTAGAGRVATLDTSSGNYKVGSGSAKMVTTTIGVTTLLYTHDFGALDLSTYAYVLLWVKSSINQNAGDCQLLLDDTAACGSPIESIDLPALTAGTWKYCRLTLAVPGSDTAIISVGIKQITDLADMSFWVDDIRAAKAVVGVKDWTLSYKALTQDVTGFDSSGAKMFVGILTEWSGAFAGFKDGAPQAISGPIGLELQESTTANQLWRGNAIITDISAKTDVAGLVAYNYTYQGTDALQIPTA